jgi:hypothetical protein
MSFRYNSRFSVFNSRLGANKFPFNLLRQLASKRLIYLVVFGLKTALFGHDRENSRFNGKNREVSSGAALPRKCRRCWQAHRSLPVARV